MSEILNLGGVDTSQLSEGLEVKNYRALCELVGEEPKTGNGKKAQLKEWTHFLGCEKSCPICVVYIKTLYTT